MKSNVLVIIIRYPVIKFASHLQKLIKIKENLENLAINPRINNHKKVLIMICNCKSFCLN
jgi:hypothetical protein